MIDLNILVEDFTISGNRYLAEELIQWLGANPNYQGALTHRAFGRSNGVRNPVDSCFRGNPQGEKSGMATR